MSTELDPIDDDLQALLRDARRIPELTAARKEAILRAVVRRVAPGGGPPGDAPAERPSGPHHVTTTATRAVVVLLGTFTAGVMVGASVVPAQRASSTDRAPPVATASSAPPERVAVPALPSPLASATEEAAEPTLSRARTPTSSAAPAARGLAAERGLLDIARASLIAGEAADALAAAEQHRRLYPEGILSEEREALAVKALLALDRTAEARSRADALARRAPGSLVLRGVRAALAERGVDAGR